MMHLWTLLYVIVGATQATQDTTAMPGQGIILTCQDPDNNFTAVKWARADQIEGDEYVLLYRDGHFEPHNQNLLFHNRVDLLDRQMKDGDVSLILKNVTTNDTGTYECRVFVGETSSWKFINTTYLSVDPPGQKGGSTEDGGKEDGGKEDGGEKDEEKEDGGKEAGGEKDEEKEDGGKEDGGKEAGGEKSGSVGLIIGLSVVAVAVVGVLIYITYKKCCQDSHRPPTEPQIEMSERFLNSGSPADEHRDRNDPEANSCHQHSTRIPDVTLTLENELLPPQETAGLLPEGDIRVQ